MRLTRRQALAVAAICGLLAALLSVLYLRPRRQVPKQPPQPKQVSVVVAAVDIPVATRLTRETVTTKKLPEDEVPEGAITSLTDAIGKVTVTKVKAGDVLTTAVVREPGTELGLSFIVPRGMRAVTVALDEVSGVAGLARPGDHVDVIATFDMPDNVSISRVVLQDVELLAVGTQLVPVKKELPESQGTKAKGSSRKPAPTATLAVTPEDAQKLVLAATKGRIRLALRRAGDTSRAAVEGVTLYALTGYKPKEQAAEAAAAQPPPWYQPPQQPPQQVPRQAGGPSKPARPTVEVVRGTEREVIMP